MACFECADDPKVHTKDNDKLKKLEPMPESTAQANEKRKRRATDQGDNIGRLTKKRKPAKSTVNEGVIEEEDDDKEQDLRWIKLEEDIFVS